MRNLLISVLLVNPVWTWLHRLGGPGLILLGLADNSLIPLPGSVDVFVVLLAAHRREWWPYYAFMAVVGAVIGGYLTYRLAEKGGEETLEKRVGKQQAEKVYKRFEKRGFITVFIGSILPPPFPMVPFLMAAGVLQYPRKKFLSALSAGRGVRYFALAWVAHVYGNAIVTGLAQYYQPVLYGLIALAVAAGIVALVYFKWYRPRAQRQERQRGEKVEEFPMPRRKHKGSGRQRA
ncbi:MAG TPA: VTT domain-containing protein [Terriglobales bacterium]|nr:VTT domain-containing protein [Terriglobales bacterium]